VPLDGSALAETALAPAEQLALGIGASVDLVGVVDVANVAVVPGSTPLEAFLAMLVAETQRNLERLAEGLRERRVVADVYTRAGVPEQVITQLAVELLTDIIVMASHGRGGVARMLLGSVALQVMQRSTVPVLLFQPAAVTARRVETPRNAPEETADREQVYPELTPEDPALVKHALGLARRAAGGDERTRRDAEQLLARLPSPA